MDMAFKELKRTKTLSCRNRLWLLNHFDPFWWSSTPIEWSLICYLRLNMLKMIQFQSRGEKQYEKTNIICHNKSIAHELKQTELTPRRAMPLVWQSHFCDGLFEGFHKQPAVFFVFEPRRLWKTTWAKIWKTHPRSWNMFRQSKQFMFNLFHIHGVWPKLRPNTSWKGMFGDKTNQQQISTLPVVSKLLLGTSFHLMFFHGSFRCLKIYTVIQSHSSLHCKMQML